MLDGVAGVNDVEASAFQRRVLDARTDAVGAFQAFAGIDNALIGFQREDMRIRCGAQECLHETAAIGTDIEQRNFGIEIGVTRQNFHRGIGAKRLAVTNIAPICAAGHGGDAARRAINARQALHQPAMIAKIYLQSAR